MQTLTLEGYLAADPSILAAQGSGKKRASFRVLETTRFRRANGEPGERTTGATAAKVGVRITRVRAPGKSRVMPSAPSAISSAPPPSGVGTTL